MSFLPSIKPKDVIRVAIKLGFVFDRQSGSHAIYYREKDKRRIVVLYVPGSKSLYSIKIFTPLYFGFESLPFPCLFLPIVFYYNPDFKNSQHTNLTS